ncbi:MAG: cytochrome c oxidase subunit II [Gammaproteobacteria bacterium]|nr:cytochrome c oxidase subunit II [Pseudomonadales bacterium]MCP5348609.1 cytochrome c oxidase subunit II [Pseudomonadales bacterium]
MRGTTFKWANTLHQVRALIPGCLLLSADCSGPQYFMAPAGPAAQGLASLGWFVMLLFIAVTLLVWGFLIWLACRRHGSLETHQPVETGGGLRWILIGGIAIPAAVFSVVFIAATEVVSHFPLEAGADSQVEIQVSGKLWWFKAEYDADGDRAAFSVATEIHIPTDRAVTIDLVSDNVIHSFWIPKLHGKVDLVPGRTNRIRLQADQPGVYSGQCAEFCGLQHANMRLSIVAEAPEDYNAWLQAQAEPAAGSENDGTENEETGGAGYGSEVVRRGAALFQDAACPGCHTIRGTPARGVLAPDLTHLASRRHIAGGMLPNNTANLSAWVTRPQSLKPGSMMPDSDEFTGVQLSALVAYLQSLE